MHIWAQLAGLTVQDTHKCVSPVKGGGDSRRLLPQHAANWHITCLIISVIYEIISLFTSLKATATTIQVHYLSQFPPTHSFLSPRNIWLTCAIEIDFLMDSSEIWRLFLGSSISGSGGFDKLPNESGWSSWLIAPGVRVSHSSGGNYHG